MKQPKNKDKKINSMGINLLETDIPHWTKEEEEELKKQAFYNEEEGEEIKRVFKALAKM